jgi:hypothetical protein
LDTRGCSGAGLLLGLGDDPPAPAGDDLALDSPGGQLRPGVLVEHGLIQEAVPPRRPLPGKAIATVTVAYADPYQRATAASVLEARVGDVPFLYAAAAVAADPDAGLVALRLGGVARGDAGGGGSGTATRKATVARMGRP